MHKNKGRSQQIRGDKRHKKQLVRKANKHANKMYLVRLLGKYGNDFDISKLKDRSLPGQKFLTDYLNA